MPAPDRAGSREVLVKRVRRLLDLDRDVYSELRTTVLPFLQSLGEVALIGGAIRDVALYGKRLFASDYDFVIYGRSRAQFVSRMETCHGIRNRFGGYGLKNFGVRIDVWHIEDTWARTAGHVSVNCPSDLLSCTFFDWDSVVYDIGSHRLMVPHDYFERLRLDIMDIRLEENPNPLGSLVRALRRAALWHVQFGPRLTSFSTRLLGEYSWREIVELDMKAFTKPVLFQLSREQLLERLSLSLPSPVGDVTLPVPRPMERPTEQLKLPIDDACASMSPQF